METGKQYAERLNRKPIGSMDLRRSMKNFWIHWTNESYEWQMDFVKAARPEILVYVMNHNG